MEYDQEDNYTGFDSTFMGAIFMSNRETKRECFERRLFGLPHVQAGFVKKIKAGMLLFLFEHEERKLYGVFEATSDGAMNIIPNAFRSMGKSFPAQIHFKRIWRCKPLSESEFGDAIRENYYQPYKFNFGLSYKQVLKLIQLFSSKRICLGEGQNYQNNLLAKFDKSNLAKTKMIGKDRSFDGLGCKMLSNLNSHLIPSSSNCRIHPSVCYDCDFPPSEDCGSGVKLTHQQSMHPPVQCASDMQQPDFRLSTSQTDGTLSRSFPVNLGHDYSCSNVLSGSRVEHPSLAFGSSGLSSAHELAPCPRTALDAQAPYFRSLPYSSNQGSEITNYPYNDYPNVSFPSSHGTYKNLSIPVNEHFNAPFNSGGFPSMDLRKSERNCESLSVPVYKPNLAFMSSEDHSNVRGHNDIPIPEHLNPTVPQKHPGLVAAKDEDSLRCMLCPGKDLSYANATQQEDDSRGYQYWHCRPVSDYIPLAVDENCCKDYDITRSLSSTKAEASDTDCSFSDSQEDDDYEGLRPFHSASGPGCPSNSVERHIYLDDFKRVSVFSRLSKNSVPHGQGVRCRINQNLSLDELVELLSQRKCQRNEEVPIQPYQDDDENLKYSSDTESGEPEEKSNILFNFKRRSETYKLKCRGKCETPSDDAKQKRRTFRSQRRHQWNEEVPIQAYQDDDENLKYSSDIESSEPEEKSNLLFNFKRRSETSKLECRGTCEIPGDDGRQKRRRFVRPSFDEDRPFCKENVEVKSSSLTVRVEGLDTSAQGGNTKNDDLSVRYVGDQNNTLYSDACFRDSNCIAYKTDKEDAVMSDAMFQLHSAKSEISTGASANLNVEEKSAVRDEILIPLVPTKFEAQKSNKVCDENVAMLDRGTTDTSVKGYINNSHETTENLNDGVEELNRCAVRDGHIIVLSDDNYGNNSANSGQKNAKMSDGSTLTVSEACDTGCACAFVENAEHEKPKNSSCEVDKNDS